MRKLQRSKMTTSQRILFNKKNPFQGSDGFTHLLFKTAHLNEHQNKSFTYKHFNRKLKEFDEFFNAKSQKQSLFENPPREAVSALEQESTMKAEEYERNSQLINQVLGNTVRRLPLVDSARVSSAAANNTKSASQKTNIKKLPSSTAFSKRASVASSMLPKADQEDETEDVKVVQKPWRSSKIGTIHMRQVSEPKMSAKALAARSAYLN